MSEELATRTVGGGASGGVVVPGRVWCVLVTLLLMPFPVVLRDFTHTNATYDFQTFLFPEDFALAVLIVLSVRPIARDLRARRLGAGWVGWLALSLLLVLAFIDHASTRGMHTLLEQFGVVAIAHTLFSASDGLHRRLIVGTVGAIAILETIWSLAQRINLGPLGLYRLGESPKPLYFFARHAIAAQGSMIHIYVLAGLALVASAMLAGAALSETRTNWWVVAAGVAAVPVGMTYSRAGLLGLLLLTACVALVGAWPLKARSLLVATVLLVGAGVPALLTSSGWRTRAQQSTSVSASGVGMTTDRGYLQRAAVDQIKAHPVLGVGPGLYVISLKNRYHSEPYPGHAVFKPVHTVPLLAAAEGGVLAGLVVTGLLAIVGWRALRSGAAAVATYLAYVPFVLLDHFAYSFPQGVVVTGLWLGTLDYMAKRWRANQGLAQARAEISA